MRGALHLVDSSAKLNTTGNNPEFTVQYDPAKLTLEQIAQAVKASGEPIGVVR